MCKKISFSFMRYGLSGIICIYLESCVFLSKFVQANLYDLTITEVSIPLYDTQELHFRKEFTRHSLNSRHVALIYLEYADANSAPSQKILSEALRHFRMSIKSDKGEVIINLNQVKNPILERIGPHATTNGVFLLSNFLDIVWGNNYIVEIEFTSELRKLSKFKPTFLIGSLSYDLP
ncbi:hypothetical protein EHQ27_16025 [Leptospira wolffii]|uniref:hypothetical protein n=1 Tax=Leptospira wolffii TaxID=409998 RepID=UPI001084297A|nr:hypothetical protein [Leptospira wolffii]TGK55117.1 hypothetical protein EHQ32_17945 [Leptospira wolffii]TGK67284.1 hypothetical protein EHQ27_16025 [Leptospira wolffii]TGK70582.1 hypothetical protein EHQ35_16565 [Leptospira wolffii]TGL29881.1 hypothetical protein EHQ57_09075 [Leptospira wolffii]